MDLLHVGVGFGFYKCSVSKTLIATSVTWFFMVTFCLPGNMYHAFAVYNPRKIVQTLSFWKFVFSKFGFYLPQTLFLGTMLLFTFKVFEQRMSSQKFLSFIFGSWLISSAVDVLIAFIFQLDFIASGMYWLIFALAVKFYHDIPEVEKIPLLGSYRANQKTISYVLLLQLALADYHNVTAVSGLVAGMIYQHNMFGVYNWLIIPNFLYKPLSTVFGTLLNSKAPKFSPYGATSEVQRQMQLDELERRFLQNRFVQQQR